MKSWTVPLAQENASRIFCQSWSMVSGFEIKSTPGSSEPGLLRAMFVVGYFPRNTVRWRTQRSRVPKDVPTVGEKENATISRD
jgi:hypothetical protein